MGSKQSLKITCYWRFDIWEDPVRPGAIYLQTLKED